MVGMRSLPLKLTWLEGAMKGRGAGDTAQTVTAVVAKPNKASLSLRTHRKMERENLLPKVVL